MGTDIHCYVEARNQETGKWEQITGFVSDYYDPESEYFSKPEFKFAESPLDSRNYDEFALLANVRNGRGFAGCDTGDAIQPISMPKGLPTDVCDSIKAQSDEWSCDGHSHSWLTAKEIKDYPADTTKKIHRGWVNATGYKQFKENGYPDSWCGFVDGRGVVRVLECDFEKVNKAMELLANFEGKDVTKVYTQVQWGTIAKESAPWLFNEALNQLMERSANGTGDDVRIVFWFDN
jgi:hypothetical protein